MGFLQRARDLAEARGYLADPVLQDFEARTPAWFRSLGTDAGLAAFQARNGVTVPLAVRELYRDPQLAYFLELATDAEYFLSSMPDIYDCEMPPIFDEIWGQRLVVSFHNHSGQCLGVEFSGDDPLTFVFIQGDEESNLPPVSVVTFSQLVYESIEDHEERLDFWQAAFEKQSGFEWVRRIPGMNARLGRS